MSRIVAWVALLALAAGGRAMAAGPDPLVAGLERLFDAALADVGPPLRIHRLEAEPDGSSATLLVLRNDRPDLVDAFTLDDGEVRGPEPVKFREYPSLEALAWHAIDAREIELGRLPAMLSAAIERGGVAGAEVTRIQLERDDSDGFPAHENVPLWTVYLSSPRRDVYVQIDPHGRVLHVETF